MKMLLNIIRWIVGVLFIFSGLIKANDPLGLSYKMQEFFEVWNLHGLHDYTLALSVLMIAFEIIAGVAVLVSWRMKLVSWLLLLLILFFTFLTGYALFSGKIKTCGCFGDCIPLTAQTSFIKDLILLALILVLFAYRNKIQSAVRTKGALSILTLATLFSFGIQWWVLIHLPVIDCLPYKKGNNLLQKMKIPQGAIPDSTVISFVYDKQGQQVEFTADKFPEDFNDSLYQFVKRYDKLVRKGNAEPAIKDFALIAPSGEDQTEQLLNTPGYYFIFFNKDADTDWYSWKKDFFDVKILATQKGIPFYLVSSDEAGLRKFLTHNIQIGDPIYRCDAVAVKTAARANPTLYLLKDGRVEEKWSYADFDKALDELQELK